MNIIDIKNDLIASVSNSSDLSAWAGATYGRYVTVFCPGDLMQTPGEPSCPAVVITPMNKSIGEERRVSGHIFAVDCWIYDDECRSPVPMENVVEDAAVDRIETFRRMVQDAIVMSGSGKNRDYEFEIEYDLDGQVPIRAAFMAVTINQHIMIGEDPLA